MKEIELTELFVIINKKIMKRLSGYSKQEGLSITEAMVLWRIQKQGPNRVSEIANFIGLPMSSVSNMLDRLVNDSWLERENDPNDRRAILLKGTEKLGSYVKRSKKASSDNLQQSFKNLSPELIERLVADLGIVLECLEQDEEDIS